MIHKKWKTPGTTEEADFAMGFHLGLCGETGYSRNFPKAWLAGYDRGQKARKMAWNYRYNSIFAAGGER